MSLSLMQAIQDFPLVFAPTEPIQVVMNAMSLAGLGDALIVENHRLVGRVTEQAVIEAIAIGLDLKTMPVSQLMTQTVAACNKAEAADISTIIKLLKQHQIQQLPVLDESATESAPLLGVITLNRIQTVLPIECLLPDRPICDAIFSPVFQVSGEVPLTQLAQMMQEKQVGYVVIIKENVSDVDPAVIITRQQLIQLQVGGYCFATTQAAEVGQTLAMISPRKTLWDAHLLMQRLQVQQLGQITGGELCGILTQMDLLQMFEPIGLAEAIQVLRHALQTQACDLQQEIWERQQLTQELAESKIRYRGILNHLPDLICCFRTDGTITFANQAYCQYFERSLSDVLGGSFFDFVADHQAISLEQLTQLGVTQGRITYEQKIQQDNGTVRWLEWTHTAICDEAGHLIEFQAVGRDMTDRLKVEQKLREEEARNRAVLNAIPDLLLRVKRNGTCLDCILPSDCQSEFLPIVQQHLAEVFPYEALQVRLQAIDRALSTGELQIIEDQFVTAGKMIYEEVRAVASGEDEALLIVRDITQRRQSEVQFQRLAEHVPGIVYRYILSPDGTNYINYISPRCEEILGCSPERILEDINSLWDLIHPNDIVLLKEKIRNSAKTIQPCQIEFQITTPFGLKWIRAFAQPEYQVNGDILWDGLAIDITENKQAIDALHASEARFRAIFEQAAVGIIQASLTGQYLQVNQWFCQLLGYTEAELLQRSIQDITHPEDWQQSQVILDRLLRGEITSGSMEKRYIRKDGQVRWAQISYSLVQDERCQQQYLLTVVEDIQDRKQAEAELRSQQSFLRQVINAVSSAIFVKDPMQRFLTANQASADIYDTTVEELIGKTDLEFNPDAEQVEEFWRVNRQVLETHQSQVIHSQAIKHTSGRTLWYHTTISPFIDTNGQLYGVIGVASDITDLKQIEAALRQAKEAAEAANLAKSQFLANMSHELRTPLNSILGFAQLLSHDRTFTPEQQDYLRIILQSGEHLLELINDVLEMSKIDAGRMSLNIESFNLCQLLESLREMLHIKAATKGIQLDFNYLSNIPKYIQADPSKLRQVLLNLLGNAIKFTMDGQVSLRVRHAPMPQSLSVTDQTDTVSLLGDRPEFPSALPLTQPAILLCFEVEDTGPGIAAAELDSLFVPFVQTELGMHRQEGTGLGLAISRRFVELMGGQIQVHSTLGQGATFSFQIPVCPLPEVPIVHPVDSSLSTLQPYQWPFRILVVEDQLTNRQLIVRILDKFGFEVQEATDGRSAIEQWEQWSPDLILMDMRMPIMDGYEASHQIRQREQQQQQSNLTTDDLQQPATVIIAVTANAFEEERSRIFKAGCNGYILKPFKAEALLKAIAEHLDISNLTHEYSASPLAASQIQSNNLNGSDLIYGVQPLLKPLSSEDLKHLSVAWRSQLYQAAVRLDDEHCMDLIQSIQVEYPDLSAALQTLVHEFRFDVLIEMMGQQNEMEA